jgi:peptidyl-prolyl cis-trans isomerase C
LIARQQGIARTPESQGQYQAMLSPMALRALITQTLLKQAAVKENVVASSEEVEAEMNDIRGQFPSPEAFTAKLKELDLDEAKLREEIAESMIMQKLVSLHTRQEGEVTDAEVKEFYDSHTEMLKHPEAVRASHILIGVDEQDSAEAKAEKKKQAEQILAQLKQGADFAELARQYSSCPSKEQGGDLGYFGRGQMVKPFEDAVFALKVGQLSGVVETQFGYHVIKKTDAKPAGTPSLDEVKDQIKQRLQGQKERQAFESYLDGLRNAATITYSAAGKQMESPAAPAAPGGSAEESEAAPPAGE